MDRDFEFGIVDVWNMKLLNGFSPVKCRAKPQVTRPPALKLVLPAHLRSQKKAPANLLLFRCPAGG